MASLKVNLSKQAIQAGQKKLESLVTKADPVQVPARVIGIDPGAKYNGYAELKLDGKTILPIGTPTTFSRRELINKLISTLDDTVVLVVEDWRTRPHEAKKGAFDWSSMDTTRVIGNIETLALIHNSWLVFQQASVKPAAYGFAGKEYKAGRANMHHWDAFVHGVYYLVTRWNAWPVGASATQPSSPPSMSELPSLKY